ncbi:MAG TPA: histidine kinase [Burkholderiaceae bacterium]|nr:histidine kinase [Burkholderiaceae bacterium]HSC00151.1 histidine kinase [Burkholderiaceae bacterium]
MSSLADRAPRPPHEVLRVLHLEDAEIDHQLACAQLQRAGFEVHALRVDTEDAFRRALAAGPWDVVLSDFNVPGFSGAKALELLKHEGPVLPFVLLSGEIGEDTAVASMRDGASDYLLKNNLARLGPAVRNAIQANRDHLARVHADSELAASRQRLAELAQHLQTSIEMERAAIAREIHDDVGGSLTALKFDLAWIGRHAGSPEVQLRVSTALEALDQAIGASQRIMHNLRPAILEQGLVPALQWMTNRFERRNNVACQFRTTHESITLPVGVPLVAYRFAQEALTNISKHAHATRVVVDLSLSAGVLSLEVTDNGRGLKPEDLTKARSFGLRGLHQRASTAGGWVDVASGPEGTTLLLSVPLSEARAHEPELTSQFDREHDPSGWGEL